MTCTIIETERLTLREFTIEDSGFILKLLNTPGWLKYIGSRSVDTIKDAEEYIENKIRISYKISGFGFYLMELRPDKIKTGMCGLVKREALDDIDIGFALLPEYEGNGYAFEAAIGVLDFAKDKLKLKSIAAITVKNNSPSIKLLGKLGMTFEKMIRLPNDTEDLMLFKKKM